MRWIDWLISKYNGEHTGQGRKEGGGVCFMEL